MPYKRISPEGQDFPPPPEEPSAAATEADFNAFIARKNKPLPTREFHVEMLPVEPVPVKRMGIEGWRITLRILKGTYSGQEVEVEFVTGPATWPMSRNWIVERDLKVLASWARQVKVKPQRDFRSALIAIGKASAKRKLKMTLGYWTDKSRRPHPTVATVRVLDGQGLEEA